jgi:thiosulfate/3-mercaptopyruvate sulfurtransferase
MDQDLPQGPLASTEWLADHLHDPRVRVLDATWRMPGDPADPKTDFTAGHIPGARFFDIDTVADRSSDLPHMAPSPEQFARQAGEMGIGDGDVVVIYDQQGLFSAARAWWTFRLFGAETVFVLDGGLPLWKAEGGPVEQGEPQPNIDPPAVFTPSFRSELVQSLDEVRAGLDAGVQVVDARAALAFAERSLNRAPACGPATCPAPATCPSTS